MAEGLRNLNPSKCWRYLFSRFVSKQVSSAQVSLTSVFGMGTGGPSLQSTPTYFFLKEKVSKKNFKPRALVRLNQACQVSAVYSFATFLVSRNRFEDASTPSKPNKVTAGMPRKRLHVFSNHSRSSPRLISTGQLHTLLHFHLRPIYVIVYDVPYSMKDERSYLRESFTLRCFQRLSRPHLATLLCRWHDNRCTRGASIPVLSY